MTSSRKMNQIEDDMSERQSEYRDRDISSASGGQDVNYESADAFIKPPVFQRVEDVGLAGMMASPFFRRALPMFAPLPLPLIGRRPVASAEFSTGGPRGRAGGTALRCPVGSALLSTGGPRRWADETVLRCPVVLAEFSDGGPRGSAGGTALRGPVVSAEEFSTGGPRG